jgi:aquaporin Z
MYTKKYLMEFIGTFFLALAISLTGNPVVIGFMLAAMIVVGGHVSGGHFNSAISLTMYLRKRLSVNDLLLYMASQTAGAFAALVFFNCYTGIIFTPDVAYELPLWMALAVEGGLTFVFCWVVATTALLPQVAYNHMPILAGLTLMMIAFIGGIFNPAVGCASFVMNAVKSQTMPDLSILWIFVAAPLLGAVIAAFAYHYFNDNNSYNDRVDL